VWEYVILQNRGLVPVCTILILGTQMLPNLHQHSHDCMSQLLLNYCLYCFLSLGTAVKLEPPPPKKKKTKKKHKNVSDVHVTGPSP